VGVEQDTQRTILGVLGTAIKSTPAAQKVDANAALFQLSEMGFGAIAPGETLDMGPLHALLVQAGVTTNDAAAVCLLVQRREDRLGVKVELPPAVSGLTEQQRNDLLAALPKTAQTGVTLGGAPPRQPTTMVKPQAATPRAAPSPQVKLPSNEPGFLKRLGISGGTIFLSILIVAAGLGVRVALSDKVPEPAKIALPSSVSHLTVFRYEELLYFYDPAKDFEGTKEELEGMAQLLWPAVTGAGASRGYLCLREDPLNCRKPKAVFRDKKVVFINKKPAGAQ